MFSSGIEFTVSAAAVHPPDVLLDDDGHPVLDDDGQPIVVPTHSLDDTQQEEDR